MFWYQYMIKYAQVLHEGSQMFSFKSDFRIDLVNRIHYLQNTENDKLLHSHLRKSLNFHFLWKIIFSQYFWCTRAWLTNLHVWRQQNALRKQAAQELIAWSLQWSVDLASLALSSTELTGAQIVVCMLILSLLNVANQSKRAAKTF